MFYWIHEEIMMIRNYDLHRAYNLDTAEPKLNLWFHYQIPILFSLHYTVIENILLYKKYLNCFLILCQSGHLFRNETDIICFFYHGPSGACFRCLLSIDIIFPACEAGLSWCCTVSTCENHHLSHHWSQTLHSYLLCQIIF